MLLQGYLLMPPTSPRTHPIITRKAYHAHLRCVAGVFAGRQRSAHIRQLLLQALGGRCSRRQIRLAISKRAACVCQR